MHGSQFGYGPAIRFWKHEADRVRVDDLQPRLWLEVHKIPASEGLLEPLLLVPVESDDLRIKGLTVMKGDSVAQDDFKRAVIEPLPTRRQAGHQLALLVERDEVLENVQRNGGPVQGRLIHN